MTTINLQALLRDVHSHRIVTHDDIESCASELGVMIPQDLRELWLRNGSCEGWIGDGPQRSKPHDDLDRRTGCTITKSGKWSR